ncbi:MAG: hypothetical protein ACT4QB_21900 [Gammaproteobacteria bacterium]
MAPTWIIHDEENAMQSALWILLILTALVGAREAPADGAPIIRFGSSTLAPIGVSTVRARIAFIDNGIDLIVIGTATGLDPRKTFISNIYDIRSVALGPNACEPTIFDPTEPGFILPTMFLGTWEVDAAGVGKLSAVNTNNGKDFVPLRKFRTVSIRQLVAPGDPPQTVLEACGRVSKRKAFDP